MQGIRDEDEVGRHGSVDLGTARSSLPTYSAGRVDRTGGGAGAGAEVPTPGRVEAARPPGPRPLTGRTRKPCRRAVPPTFPERPSRPGRPPPATSRPRPPPPP